MLNSLGKLSFSGLTDYQNNIIKDITETIEYYAVSDTRKALSIRYLKLQSSDNTDDETSVMQKSFNSTFYAYHLTPVLENQMINPSVQDDETKQGITSNSMGEMVMIAISQPLPNDLFNFYVDKHQGLKDMQTEVFKITDVQFLRTSAGLNVYRCSYETAQVEESKLFIPKAFFWYNEFRKFYSIKYITNMQEIASGKLLLIIKKYYRPEWSIVYDFNLTKEVNLKLNKILLFIKHYEPSNSTNLPLILLNGFNASRVKEPFVSENNVASEDSIEFAREDVWYPNPNFIFDPSVEWQWTNDKIPNELAKAIWDLMNLYKPFIFYAEMDRSQEADTNINIYHDVELNRFVDKLKTKDSNAIDKISGIFSSYKEN